MNKITKGVFELGSIFKTFTITLALENKLFSPDTVIKDIPNEIKCSKYTITEHDELPSSLTLRDILIRSSNIGTIKLQNKLEKINLKNF
jgi:cell division protein FtsI (penicillin-binding protein 3)